MSGDSLLVQTCGADVEVRNPYYHNRFQTVLQEWVRSTMVSDGTAPLGTSSTSSTANTSTSCAESCVPFGELTGTTGGVSPLGSMAPSLTHYERCVACMKQEPTPAITLGGGCSLCAEVVAVWAWSQVPAGTDVSNYRSLLLPTRGDELQIFLASDTSAAYQAWNQLSSCQRAEWVQRVCGATDRGEVQWYPVGGSNPITTPENSSTFWTTRDTIILVVVLGCFALGFLVYVLYRRSIQTTPKRKSYLDTDQDYDFLTREHDDREKTIQLAKERIATAKQEFQRDCEKIVSTQNLEEADVNVSVTNSLITKKIIEERGRAYVKAVEEILNGVGNDARRHESYQSIYRNWRSVVNDTIRECDAKPMQQLSTRLQSTQMTLKKAADQKYNDKLNKILQSHQRNSTDSNSNVVYVEDTDE